MAIEATGVENVMEEVAHFWQLRKFQFIEEATDFWMDAVAPKECFIGKSHLKILVTICRFLIEKRRLSIDNNLTLGKRKTHAKLMNVASRLLKKETLIFV